jgi:hypothetical protein
MEANAALRTIVRREGGETYREMLRRMAAESGIETPTGDDMIRLDRTRPGKKLSNTDWESPTDPDARITRTEDGRTHIGGIHTLAEAKVLIEPWRVHDNTIRPHSSLRYRPPAPEVIVSGMAMPPGNPGPTGSHQPCYHAALTFCTDHSLGAGHRHS